MTLAFIGTVLSNTYRPYVYSQDMDNTFLADTIGSLICVPSATLFLWSIYPRKNFIKMMILVFFSFIIYEFLGLIGFHGVFDLYDILAITVGCMATFLFYLLFIKEKEKTFL